MIYPEMPKSKKKMTYIIGGIFALLVGLVIFLLFLPSFLDKNFGFKPWDWTTIIPDINTDFFGAVGFYIKLAIPIVLLLCTISSFFMGLSKSGGFFKGSILASCLALVLKHSLEPANLTSGIKDVLGYVCYVLIAVALTLAIMASIFRFMGEEPYAPFKANSFHFYASYALIIITAVDVFAKVLGFNAIISNEHYYLGTVLGLFLIIAAVWMFCTSTRDPSEFGLGYERDAKRKAEQKENPQNPAPAEGTAPAAQELGQDGKPITPFPQMNEQAEVPEQTQPQTEQPSQEAPEQPQAQVQAAPQPAPQQPAPQPIPQQPTPPRPTVGSNGQPLTPMPPKPPTPQGMGSNGQPMPPRPPIGPNGQPMPPRPPIGPNGQPMPPRPPIGPNGQPLPPRPPIGPNGQPMPPRPPIGPNGQPLPPRPATAPNGVPPQNVAQPQQPQVNNSEQKSDDGEQ